MKSLLIKALWTSLLCGLPLMAAAQSSAPVPQPGQGRIERIYRFESKFVEARHIDVWLPADYSSSKPYAVVYMHDGQMLYDASTTWNQQAWKVDAAVTKLVAAGRIPDTIVVGIWNNTPQRYAEYYPEKFLALAPEAARREYIEKAQNGRPLADAYLRFIVEELKPSIDRRYSTRTGPESTFVVGSSMGGLISLYALCEYPRVFGGAAGLSTHWVGAPTAWGAERMRESPLPQAALAYLKGRLPPPAGHHLWLDRGSDALDSLYAPSLGAVGVLLRERGYSDANGATRVFEGTGHNERDWGARLDQVLLFLMGATG
jgi:enterochelin esterase-like enzyme